MKKYQTGGSHLQRDIKKGVKHVVSDTKPMVSGIKKIAKGVVSTAKKAAPYVRNEMLAPGIGAAATYAARRYGPAKKATPKTAKKK